MNQGGIDGGHGYGVYLDAGGVVTNSGVITGYFDGFASTGDATVFNQGSISGSQASGNGINLFAGGTVTNSGLHARIAGPRRGVWVQGSAGSVINQGTIAGGEHDQPGVGICGGRRWFPTAAPARSSPADNTACWRPSAGSPWSTRVSYPAARALA